MCPYTACNHALSIFPLSLPSLPSVSSLLLSVPNNSPYTCVSLSHTPTQVVVGRMWKRLSVLLHANGVPEPEGESPAAPAYQADLQRLIDEVCKSEGV